MPLEMDSFELRQGPGYVRWRQVADHIRAQIVSEQLAPGEDLPSEGDMSRGFGVSRDVVQQAVRELVREELVEKRSGMPSQVSRPALVRHMATSRYRDELDLLRKLDGAEHPAVSAFTRDHSTDWDNYSVTADYREGVAGSDDARRLRVPVGAPVLRRSLIKFVDHRPVQLQESVMPLGLVAGTPVADEDRQPWPGGTFAELWSIDQIVTRVVEEATARMSTPDEQQGLDLPSPRPVFDIERVFWVDGYPVEASTVVCVARGVILQWETDLS